MPRLLCLALVFTSGALQAAENPDQEQRKLIAEVSKLASQGKLADAAKLLEEAIPRYEKEFGKDSVRVGQLTQSLGTVERLAGRLDRAETHLTRALEVFEKQLSKDHKDLAPVLLQLGIVHLAANRHAKAEAVARRALPIVEARAAEAPLFVALTLETLGAACAGQRKFDEAGPLLKRGLAIREKAQGKEHPDVAQNLRVVARMHQAAAEYPRAEAYYRRELEIREKHLKANPVAVVLALLDLATVYRLHGDPMKAAPLAQRALDLATERLGPNHLLTGRGWHVLGRIELDLGQFTFWRAVASCSEIYKKHLSQDHPVFTELLVDEVMDEIGKGGRINRYRGDGLHGKVKAKLEEGLKVREAKVGKDDVTLAPLLHYLGVIHFLRGQLDQARPPLERALAMREKAFGRTHPDFADSLHAMGLLRQQQGQRDKADRLFRECLEVRELRLAPHHPAVAEVVHDLAMLAAEQGQDDRAIAYFDRSRRLARGYNARVLPGLNQKDQALFLSPGMRAFADALRKAVKLANRAAVNERSAGWVINGKAEGADAASASLAARDSDDPAVRKLAEELHTARRRLAGISYSNSVGLYPERKKAEGVEHQLARAASAACADSTFARYVESGDIRAALPPDAVFIDLAIVTAADWRKKGAEKEVRLAAWITPGRGDVRVVNLGNAAVTAFKKVAKALEESGQLIRAKGEAAADEQLRGDLEELSKAVLVPLLPHIGKTPRWVVCPDSWLARVPWELMLLPGGQYAAEKYTISYVGSGRELARSSPFKGRPSAPVIVADPDYGPGPGATARRPSGGNALRLGTVTRLPATRAEAKAIEANLAAYAGQKPRVLLGKDATEANVLGVRSPHTLVVATHGFHLTWQKGGSFNNFLQGGLLLAGCNEERPHEDDGVLTALEVVGIDLRRTELVVLSGCETALGTTFDNYAMEGLSQVFRLAGAKAVVAAQWKVPDAESARLMTRFFAALAAGKDRAGALREAKVKLIEERRDDSACAHPFFWAAFTLTGR